MKVLFFQWHSFMNEGMERALQELCVDYDVFFYQFSDWERDDVFLERFAEKVCEKAYDVVLSVNFSPLISNVCEEKGIRYVSWVYDSPLHIRDISALHNSCNEIFFFDRGQADMYQKSGINARHLPLAVDTEVFSKCISGSKSTGYEADISFVGQLYQTEYTNLVQPLNGYLQGYLEGIMSAQSKIYGGYLIPELISDDLLEQMNKEYAKVSDTFRMGRKELEFMLACETTGRERYLALALLARDYGVHVYSTDKESKLNNIRFCGYVDYYTQMPLIFAKSKLNLNISLKTIQTGIPLRVLDIMGCGGFVLTNYQMELEEYFDLSNECVVYMGMDDLYEKANYYMHHDTERERIAQAGLERVKRDFTFRDRVGRLLHV